MSKTPVSILVITLMLSISSYSSEIYKWVDKDGKVHYSDKKPDHLKSQVENVEVTSGINALPNIDVKSPIKYRGTETLDPIDLLPMKIEFPGAQYNDYKMGKLLRGRDCHIRVTDIFWVDGNAYVKDILIEQTFIERFMTSGYMIYGPKMQSKLGKRNRYQLSAKLVDLNLLSCIQPNTPGVSKNNVYVKVVWEMTDRLMNTVVYSGSTEGLYRGHKKPFRVNGEEQSIVRALKVAIDNLLADQSFVDLLTQQSNKRPLVQTFSPIFIDLHASNTTSFRQVLPALRDATVTIRTQNGHGSGVILSNQGYVITNSHVVEGASKLLIIYQGKEYDASIVRTEPLRDVALLKFRIDVEPQIPLANARPMVGDDLYVIGTPLSEQLSHTVTRGILSAVREEDGLVFYQTDATINPGNSGGPIFDAQGNLVALSVAGLFSKSGAGLGVNYLIPIEDAFKALSINVVSGNAKGRAMTATSTTVLRDDQPSSGTKANNSSDTTLPKSIKDKIFELYSSAISFRERGKYVEAGDALTLAMELVPNEVNSSDIQLVKDELNFELPLAIANEKLTTGDVHGVQEIIYQLKNYMKDHPNRFELSKRISELSKAVQFLQKAQSANAMSKLINVKTLLSEYFSYHGVFPETKEKLIELLRNNYNPSVLVQYSVFSYKVSASEYRIVFRDKVTLKDHVIEGAY